MSSHTNLWQDFKGVSRRTVRQLQIHWLGMNSSEEAARQQAILMLRQKREAWPAVQERFDTVVGTLNANSVCIDCGANLGEFTEALAKTGAEVHAIEPDPYTFERLKARVSGYKNVHLYNAAIGAEPGSLTMERHARFQEDPEKFSVGTSAFSSTLGESGGDRFSVDMLGFHDFVASLGCPVDLVKMDIEGAEVAVLEALLAKPPKHPIKTMFVETHEPQMPQLRSRLASIRKRLKPSDKLPEVHLDWQ